MLIINADDLGRSAAATDAILACHGRGLITSASAMVFMKDSERAAEAARAAGLETGLHFNLTLPWDGPGPAAKLRDRQRALARYFRSTRLTEFIYNPFLRGRIADAFKAQYDEFVRIFDREPAQIDGHHHAHLFPSVLLGKVMPEGSKVRRSFSFRPGEKSFLNRTYRSLVDAYLTKRHCCADYFFSLDASDPFQRIRDIAALARTHHVEAVVHPEREETMRFLLDGRYLESISGVPRGTYRMIPGRNPEG
jgi:hypothetical protein